MFLMILKAVFMVFVPLYLLCKLWQKDGKDCDVTYK